MRGFDVLSGSTLVGDALALGSMKVLDRFKKISASFCSASSVLCLAGVDFCNASISLVAAMDISSVLLSSGVRALCG